MSVFRMQIVKTEGFDFTIDKNIFNVCLSFKIDWDNNSEISESELSGRLPHNSISITNMLQKYTHAK